MAERETPMRFARAATVNFPAFILTETALIFFRPLLLESEDADQLFEFLVFSSELGDLEGARAGVVGLVLDPAIDRVPTDAVFGANFGNGRAVLNF